MFKMDRNFLGSIIHFIIVNYYVKSPLFCKLAAKLKIGFSKKFSPHFTLCELLICMYIRKCATYNGEFCQHEIHHRVVNSRIPNCLIHFQNLNSSPSCIYTDIQIGNVYKYGWGPNGKLIGGIHWVLIEETLTVLNKRW